MPKTKIAIFGVGAMGSLFGGLMQKNNPDLDITMFGSWREQIDQINRSGLIIEELDASENTHKIRAASDPGEIQNTDIAIVLG